MCLAFVAPPERQTCRSTIFFLISAIFGFTLLETVNYLEHYGLLRKKLDNGRYERCAPVHSWNSDHICTNIYCFLTF